MRTMITRIAFISIVSIFAFNSEVSAVQINATSCSQTAVQAAVTSAVVGDTVSIPAGACTWTSDVSWSNKNINVIGSGIGNTIITSEGTVFDIIANSSPASFRVSGMTIKGTAANATIFVQSWGANNGNGAAIKGWRFDNIRFDYSYGTIFNVGGVSWGLIDNCTFDSTSGGGYTVLLPWSMINAEDPNPNIKGTYSAGLPVNLGSDEAIYIEDCTFNFTSGTTGIADGLYGSRVVIRHNTAKYTYFYTHSARSRDRGAKVIEVYNNTFVGAGFFRPAQIRSGSGVIFNNTITGYQLQAFSLDDQRACKIVVDSPLLACDGGRSWDGNIEASGWPCLDQIGRGAGSPGSQVSMPLYIWNNGTTSTCATGGACNNSVKFAVDACAANYIKTTAHSNGVVDLVDNGSTPKPGYTAYTYPHPLRMLKQPTGIRVYN